MMITLTIDGQPYLFAHVVRVAELYARAQIDPAEKALHAAVDPRPLLDLNQRLKFTGHGGFPSRVFTSTSR